MSRRTPVRSLGRSTRTRAATADVPVRYCCPRCGGDHPRTECGLIAQTRTALHTLGPDELRGLRQQALEELAAAVRADAKRVHVEGVLRLLDAVDARLPD